QDLVEIGLPTNERTGRAMLGIPRRIDRRDTRCAVDAIDVDEADAERLARDAERYAYLERESVGRLLPETLYAILVILGRREPRRARASRPKRPRRARAEHERLDDARVALDGDDQPVPEETLLRRAFVDDLVVARGEKHVRVTVVRADPQPVPSGNDERGVVGRRPIAPEAVESGFRRQRRGVQGIAARAAADSPLDQRGLLVERGRDRASAREHRLL